MLKNLNLILRMSTISQLKIVIIQNLLKKEVQSWNLMFCVYLFKTFFLIILFVKILKQYLFLKIYFFN